MPRKRKGKKGKAAKRAKQTSGGGEPEELVKAPHSFVIYRGHVGRNAGQLMFDFRKVMEPFTATHLKVQKQNSVKDFLSVAGPLNVTHIVIFTKTEAAMYMKIVRLPRGPTLTFRIHGYTLTRDVLSSLKKRVTYASQFMNHPLVVMNNFSGEGMHMKLMTSMFQNMFPSINVNKVKLNSIRRCVLLDYNSDTKHIEFRHYTIKVVPCGISRAVKKLVQGKVPDLSKYTDFSEYVMKAGNLSESEAEGDGPHNEVTLPQPISTRGVVQSQQSSIRLVELGPRLTIQLIKIEDGFMEGDVLYHEYIKKTPEEIEALKARKQKQLKLKQVRKQQQKENVERKKQELEKKKHREGTAAGGTTEPAEEEESEDEDDAEWYRKEVGEEPDKDLFPAKRAKEDTKSPCKKLRISDEKHKKPLVKKKVMFRLSAKKQKLLKEKQPSNLPKQKRGNIKKSLLKGKRVSKMTKLEGKKVGKKKGRKM